MSHVLFVCSPVDGHGVVSTFYCSEECCCEHSYTNVCVDIVRIEHTCKQECSYNCRSYILLDKMSRMDS